MKRKNREELELKNNPNSMARETKLLGASDEIDHNIKVQVNFNLEDELDKRFREVVYKTKGYKRGAITEAYEEAIKLWIEEMEHD